MNSLLLDATALMRCKELLQNVCGFKFGQDRDNFLQAALHKRMLKLGFSSLDTYTDLLVHNAGEFQCLVELLTVNETYFFREPEHLKLLVERLVPDLLTKVGGRRLKIISAGCSSGAEPYSVAILLRECFGARSNELFSIYGMDIDASVVSHARKAAYGKGFFRGVDPLLVERYFTIGDFAEMRLKDEIKKEVSFEVINLLNDQFPLAFQQADAILYRNVSIYFPEHVQKIIFGKLADLLVDGGYLVVGATETIPHDFGVLTLVERDGLFVYQKLPGFTLQERRSLRRDDTRAVKPELRTTASTPPVSWKRPVTRLPHLVETEKQPAKKVVSTNVTAPAVSIKSAFDEALSLATGGNVDKALAQLATLIKQEPDFVPAHTLAASIHLNNAHFNDARTAAKRALQYDPLCSEATLMLGMIERHEGNTDLAYSRFREAKYLNADCWLAYIHLGEIDFAREERQRARSSYAAALSLLEKGSLQERGQDFFPLIINAEQFLQLCRHKISLLAKGI